MAYLLRTETTDGRRYYAGYDGVRPSLRTKAGASRMDPATCKTVQRQLTSLGFKGYDAVDEYETDKVVEL